MPDEVRFIEILNEVEGVGPVEWLEIDPARRVVLYRTLMPVLVHQPDGEREVRATGFEWCMN
jgi:hypothetical protein